MSVRSRIDKFESLSTSKDREKDEDAENTTKRDAPKKKRFQLPGKNFEADMQPTGTSFITNNKSPKSSGFQNFEADLQEVWSVRKNIHHKGGSNKHNVIPSSTSSSAMVGVQAKGGQYSRHGAIPAQPTLPASKGPFSRGTGNYASGMEHPAESSKLESNKRTPLQDFNSKESPWNVKKGGYSYNYHTSVDGMAKRSIDSSKATETPFLPAAKRRINAGGMNVVRPTAGDSKGTLLPIQGSLDTQNDKVSYAKRMAQGYLRSVGIGEFTPKSDGYSKQETPLSPPAAAAPAAPARWKKLDNDQEFEFDI